MNLPDCPNCELGGFVNRTELGYLCTLCLHHWPYEPGDFYDEAGADADVLAEVRAELERARAKFPDQHLPDGTIDNEVSRDWSNAAKRVTEFHAKGGIVTWRDVLNEEVCEAFAETEWPLLRAELVQVAAMAVRWIEDGDRRGAT